MITLENISYTHPHKEVLFSDISFTVNTNSKAALIGNNGTGKSTLLKIIAGEILPTSGQVTVPENVYYVPQIFGQYNHLTIAQLLRIDLKINALKEILNGSATNESFEVLNDDWTIEERCYDALNRWGLGNLDLAQKVDTLSGGQKTSAFLAGIHIHQPALILLDEPSNHLDVTSRRLLYDFIESTKSTLLVVSHDRKLLNLFDTIFELGSGCITTYGGNYDFYKEQKLLEINALSQDVLHAEKALRMAKEKERETLERQQKLDNRGKAKQEKAGVARIMMNTLRNNAENSTSKIKGVHEEKIKSISGELHELRSALAGIDKMKFGFENSALPKKKVLFKAEAINYSYGKEYLWKEDLTFQINCGDRLSVKGRNGSGKTTLVNILLGKLEPSRGMIHRADTQFVSIDQEYSLINNRSTIYEQAQQFNTNSLPEHEIKIRLHRFLFKRNDWDKLCEALSGGEKIRLILCCLTISAQSPDMIIMDEPTNNLDLHNVEVLAESINAYKGTVIVISHDTTFLEQINSEQSIQL